MPQSETPEFSFGSGRNQINLKGKEAIREGGWSIRLLLAARAVAILLTAVTVFMIAFWRVLP